MFYIHLVSRETMCSLGLVDEGSLLVLSKSNLSTKQHQQHVNIRGRHAGNATCLRQRLWIDAMELLSSFSRDFLQLVVVEPAFDANVLQAMHLVGYEFPAQYILCI